MAAEVGIWRVDGDKTAPVTTSPLVDEKQLEDILERDPSILGLGTLVIVGRQVINRYGSRLDLLALDDQGGLYVIEVKKKRTPREVVAQALDYGYWVAELDLNEVADLYTHHHDGEDLEAGWRERFDADPPDTLADEHQLVIVASEIDPSTDRIVRYVRDRGVPIYVVCFQHFSEGGVEFLARTWDADPETEVKPKAKQRKPKAPWNGQDFYVSFGENEARNWDDAVRYGFISAGGGSWYSKTLQQLFVGARLFAYIPQTGYVGVGTVKETARPVKEFRVDLDGQRVPILDAPLKSAKIGDGADDEDLSEYLVRVEWLKTLPREQAFQEKGLFANQNSAVKLRDAHTLERLTEVFGLDGTGED